MSSSASRSIRSIGFRSCCRGISRISWRAQRAAGPKSSRPRQHGEHRTLTIVLTCVCRQGLLARIGSVEVLQPEPLPFGEFRLGHATLPRVERSTIAGQEEIRRRWLADRLHRIRRGRGRTHYGGAASVDVCLGRGSGGWTPTLRVDSRQEPYAVVPHVRICAGGGERSPSLPRP
jgi:hypothetical protein